VQPIWPDAPRYGPDEPFPPYRYVPGGPHPHPVRDPDGHSHGAEEEPDFRRGIDLYHAGYLWEAHEAWEGVWKASSDPALRDLCQGLIFVAAALLKVHAGNPGGVRKLVPRARKRLAGLPDRCHGLDVTDVRSRVETCFGPVLDGGPLDDKVWRRAPRLLYHP